MDLRFYFIVLYKLTYLPFLDFVAFLYRVFAIAMSWMARPVESKTIISSFLVLASFFPVTISPILAYISF